MSIPSIEQQLDLEKEMTARGQTAYFKSKEAAIEQGRGAETGAARRLMSQYLDPMVEELTALISKKGPGINGKAKAHLRKMEPATIIFITLKNLFNSFTADKQLPTAIANNIGRMVEDELRFSLFEQKFSGYYKEIMEDFKRKGTKNYRYMHRVLTHSANANEDGWTPWVLSERVQVGMFLLDIVLRCSDLVTKQTFYIKGKTTIRLAPTQAALDWISNYDDAASIMYPEMMPCIIPPDPWSDLTQGGYYSPKLRDRARFVLTKNNRHKQLLQKSDLTKVMEAVNGAQDVAWKVNSKVLEVAKLVWAKNLGVGMPNSEKLVPSESPFKHLDKGEMTDAQARALTAWKREASEIYTQERERQSKCFQVHRIMQLANEYAEREKFWFVWTLDFRGRMYTTTSGFSPQGPDLAKGMLTFSEGKRLGERGVYWLKVHGANRYGNDKVHYDDRVKWVDENHSFFMAAAKDPIAHMDVWAKADKPYQFLAFLFEYRAMHDGKLVGKLPEDYVSYLPVGLDGSCNGLQHFSAMLRDQRGGAATNLTSGPVPNDIYREVADVCLRKVRLLRTSTTTLLSAWSEFANMYGEGKGLPRAVAKRPVMTMPYGSTRQSCTQYINEAVNKYNSEWFGKGKAFTASVALTPIMWESIGEVVVAARLGMEWLQKAASAMGKKGLGVTWQTPDGFLVHMFEPTTDIQRTKTQLAGMFVVRIGNATTELNKRRQRNAVAPNFVHSMDAAHLRATIIKARARGITSLALIHDDYGTHAADTDGLHSVIRECFVEQYSGTCPLERFKAWQEAILGAKLPDLPPKGTLDITEVLRSEFFFG